jgi:hypothetical protein
MAQPVLLVVLMVLLTARVSASLPGSLPVAVVDKRAEVGHQERADRAPLAEQSENS